MGKEGNKLNLYDWLMLSVIFFCGLIVIYLDTLARQGIGIRFSANSKISTAILVELFIVVSMLLYGFRRNSSTFFFAAFGILILVFIIGMAVGVL